MFLFMYLLKFCAINFLRYKAMLIAILKPAETPAVGVSIVIVSVPALVVIVVPPVPAKFKVTPYCLQQYWIAR